MASNSSDVAKSQAEKLYKKAQELRENAKSKDEIKQAFKLFIEAADKGFAPAQVVVGKLYCEMDGNFYRRKIQHYFEAAANQDDPESIAHTLNLYTYGGMLPPKDIELYLNKARKHEHAEIFAVFGDLYFNGESTIPIAKNVEKSFEFYKKAADLGHAGSCWAVAKFYDSSQPKYVWPQKDNAKALEYYKNAAALNELSAIKKLIRIYKIGDMAPRHKLKVKELQQKLSRVEKQKNKEYTFFIEVLKELGIDEASVIRGQFLPAYQSSSSAKDAADTIVSEPAVSNSLAQAKDIEFEKGPKKTT